MGRDLNEIRKQNDKLDELLTVIKDNIDYELYCDLREYFYSDDENEICALLGEAWNKFTKLEVAHSHDFPEFTKAIHEAMNIVQARVALRQTDIFGKR